MTKNSRALIILGVMVLIIGLLCIVIYQLFWFGTITITGSDKYTNLSVNAEYAERGRSITLRVRPGDYSYRATAPLLFAEEDTVSIGPFGSKTINLPANERSVNDIISQKGVAGQTESSDFTVQSHKFFENNLWMVALVVPASSGEGSTLTYRYKDGLWSVESAGTGLDEDDYRSAGYPASVISYIMGSSQ